MIIKYINIIKMNILVCFIIIVLILLVIMSPYREHFKIIRNRGKGKVQVGTLTNTPGPIKNLMVDLNKVGGQLVADSKYDTVATGYLNEKKIP